MLGIRSRKARLVAPLIAVIAMMAALLSGATPASASNTCNDGGGYLYSNQVEGNSYSATVTVTRDPGNDADVFWSNQFGMSNSVNVPGGYFGMQTNAEGGYILVSVWGSTGCTAASPAIRPSPRIRGDHIRSPGDRSLNPPAGAGRTAAGLLR
jgi:hypothetical protein